MQFPGKIGRPEARGSLISPSAQDRRLNFSLSFCQVLSSCVCRGYPFLGLKENHKEPTIWRVLNDTHDRGPGPPKNRRPRASPLHAGRYGRGEGLPHASLRLAPFLMFVAFVALRAWNLSQVPQKTSFLLKGPPSGLHVGGGRADESSLQSWCHSPHRRRWFDCNLTAMFALFELQVTGVCLQIKNPSRYWFPSCLPFLPSQKPTPLPPFH